MDIERVQSIASQLASDEGWSDLTFIDAGASAAVFSIQHPLYQKTALKVYDPRFFQGANALIEVSRVMLQLELRGHKNEHLIKILEAREVLADGTWFILMEFCPWPSLEKQLKTVPNDSVSGLIKKLVDAVRFLDSRQLVHRDIKPANIAISPDGLSLKLLDLGVLRKLSPDDGNGTDDLEKNKFIATTQYSPPEYLAREEAAGKEGFAALNIYQVGAVLHDLIMKVPIFFEESSTGNRFLLHRAIATKRVSIFNPQIEPRLISLCRACLEKDPTQRLLSVELKDFEADVDTADAIRKRLAASKGSRGRDATPSLDVWRRHVKRWLAGAASAESDVVGSFTLAEDQQGRPEWILTFTDHDCAIRVALARAKDGPYLVLNLQAGSSPPIPVLEVYQDGPRLDEKAVNEQIREQLLYIVGYS